MGFYKIADRTFEIKERFGYIKKACADYAGDPCIPDYSFEVSDEDMTRQREGMERAGEPSASDEYLEFLSAYRYVSEFLWQDDCFLLHAAVITFDGRAYAFTAKSGTGKTTHVRLWKKCFGDRVQMVNGDKPLVRRQMVDGKYQFVAYGTPWCGKERYQKNTRAVLDGICVVTRGEKNEIERIESEEAVPVLYGQMLILSDKKYMLSLLDMIDSMVTNIPVYRLRCNMDDEAAKVACRAMTGAEI